MPKDPRPKVAKSVGALPHVAEEGCIRRSQGRSTLWPSSAPPLQLLCSHILLALLARLVLLVLPPCTYGT